MTVKQRGFIVAVKIFAAHETDCCFLHAGFHLPIPDTNNQYNPCRVEYFH